MPLHRKLLVGFVALCALFLALPLRCAADISHARIVRLSFVQGDVQVAPDAQSAWQKALVNTPVREGVRMATGDGHAEVEFENGAEAWVSTNTLLEFPQLAMENGAKLSQLTVTQGTATVYVKPKYGDSFVVQAGQLQIRAPAESRFRVDVFEDGVSVSVSRGGVDVDVHGNIQHLAKNHTLGFRYDAPGDPAVVPSLAADSWDTWVAQRQETLDSERYDAHQYAPAPLTYGFADLAYYGGWFTLPGYGYAWRPWGVGLGWVPFTSGFWDPLGGFGPAWVSYEPWGWIPYHFGGWVYSGFYGWVWVPGTLGAWSPATVYFVRTPNAIGWVPRAPNDPANGTPVNLRQGMIVHSTSGAVGGTQNVLTPMSSRSDAQVIRNWHEDPEVGRITQNAALQRGSSAPGATQPVAAGIAPAARMPAGSAPRLSAIAPPMPRDYAARTSRPASSFLRPPSAAGSASRPSSGYSAPSSGTRGAAGGTSGSSSASSHGASGAGGGKP